MKWKKALSVFSVIVLFALIFIVNANVSLISSEHIIESVYSDLINKKDVTAFSHIYRFSDELKEKLANYSNGNYSLHPLTCAPEVPLRFETTFISETETNAEIGVREYFTDIAKDIRITLMRESSIWKITNIDCGDFPKSEAN